MQNYRTESSNWASHLVKKGYLGSPLVEVTPFVWRNRLYRLENWQRIWDMPPGTPSGYRFTEDQIRIRDVERDQIVSVPLTGHAFGIAFVWDDMVYVFAGDYGSGKPFRHITELVMTRSTDLHTWSAPCVVLTAENDEFLYNTGLCHDGKGFVLLYETDDKQWLPPFTFKYCRSQDLVHWERVPGAVFGRHQYVGGPALYFEGGWYYTLYLHDRLDCFPEDVSGPYGSWETRVARSRDLIHWQEAPADRPFVTYDRRRHPPMRPDQIREINASDAELCAWRGRTVVYFTGGDQRLVGDLQLAEFEGSPRELLEHYFEGCDGGGEC